MDRDRETAATSATERTPLLATKDVAPAADPAVAEAVASSSASTTLHGSGYSTPPGNERGGIPRGGDDHGGSTADDRDGDDGDDDDDDDDDDDPPLPKWQVFWLCFARLVEPMAFFSIFPYINQMAQENGHLADADVGFYSGLIESLFSLTQAVVMIFWGRAADRLGRKPVLVFSLVGVSAATSVFGTARTLGQMVLFRCLAGVFAGTIVTIRAMLTELSTRRTQAVAFSWFAFSGNLGILLGPVLGGALADPARQYPGLFGGSRFLLDYPYALSSFVVAGLGLVAAFTSALFVQETLEGKKKGPELEEQEEGGVVGGGTTALGLGDDVEPPLGIVDILRAPGVGVVLYVYCHIMLLAFAYTAIMPVFLFSPVRLGGWGLAPYQISIFMAVNGAAQALWLLVAFPPLQRRLGTNRVLRACSDAYPFFFVLAPLGNLLLRHGDVTVFWALAPAVQAVGCGVSMAFTAIQLTLNDVAPDMRVLGTLNSLALTGVSLMRAFAPALFTSLFAVGARTQWLGGHAIWLLLVVMAGWFTVVSRWLPEKEQDKRKTTTTTTTPPPPGGAVGPRAGEARGRRRVAEAD